MRKKILLISLVFVSFMIIFGISVSGKNNKKEKILIFSNEEMPQLEDGTEIVLGVINENNDITTEQQNEKENAIEEEKNGTLPEFVPDQSDYESIEKMNAIIQTDKTDEEMYEMKNNFLIEYYGEERINDLLKRIQDSLKTKRNIQDGIAMLNSTQEEQIYLICDMYDKEITEKTKEEVIEYLNYFYTNNQYAISDDLKKEVERIIK